MNDFERCPCCALPTLDARGEYEMCPVCWWEDAPDPEAAALTRARANYADHFDAFDPGGGIGIVARPSPARRALLAYLAAIRDGERPFDAGVLHGLLRTEAAARMKDHR